MKSNTENYSPFLAAILALFLFPAVRTGQYALFKVAGTDLFDLRNLTQTFIKCFTELLEVSIFREFLIQLPACVLVAFAGDQTVTLRPVAAVDIDLAEVDLCIFEVYFAKFSESGSLASLAAAARR